MAQMFSRSINSKLTRSKDQNQREKRKGNQNEGCSQTTPKTKNARISIWQQFATRQRGTWIQEYGGWTQNKWLDEVWQINCCGIGLWIKGKENNNWMDDWSEICLETGAQYSMFDYIRNTSIERLKAKLYKGTNYTVWKQRIKPSFHLKDWETELFRLS